MDMAIKLKKSNIKQIFIKNNNRRDINNKNNYPLFNKAQNRIKNKFKINLFLHNNFRILLNIITIIIILSTCLSKNIEFRKLTSIYEITIILKGTGNQYILSDSCPLDSPAYRYEANPDEIIINGDSKTEISKSYDLTQETNVIKMIWNNGLTRFRQMFCGISNIISAEVKSSISTDITDLRYMFAGCSQLESIDFSNFDSSKVVFMGYLFYECISLKSIDLSYFNFASLKYMNYMFSGCTSLKSIDFSNLNIPLLDTMLYMFNGCISLESINLSN